MKRSEEESGDSTDTRVNDPLDDQEHLSSVVWSKRQNDCPVSTAGDQNSASIVVNG
jgi:hypothetical protein